MRRRTVGFLLALGIGAIGASCGSVEVGEGVPETPEPPPDATLDPARDGALVDGAHADSMPDSTAASDGSVEANVEASIDPTIDAGDDADAGDEPDPVLVRFAVVGDYGNGSARASAVASLILAKAPDFVVTTGDNNYSLAVDSYDPNVGQFYHSFIAPYAGAYGAGAAANAFFPSVGNHDWDVGGLAPYLAFFTLPGNGRYFELDKGPVHFVFLDSDVREPDGTAPDSVQGTWAQAALAASAAPFQFVVFHHPTLSSGGSNPYMDWGFKAWGADAVLNGHVHNYERLRAGNLSYFVVGQGGVSTNGYGTILGASELRYNAKDGAQIVDVSMTRARFRYYNVDDVLIDDYSIDANGDRVF